VFLGRLCCDFQTADAADFADVTLILFCLNLKKNQLYISKVSGIIG
jgi:hypothetical protein